MDNDWCYIWENILNYFKIFGKYGLIVMIGSSIIVYGYEKVLVSGVN